MTRKSVARFTRAVFYVVVSLVGLAVLWGLSEWFTDRKFGLMRRRIEDVEDEVETIQTADIQATFYIDVEATPPRRISGIEDAVPALLIDARSESKEPTDKIPGRGITDEVEAAIGEIEDELGEDDIEPDDVDTDPSLDLPPGSK